MSTASAEVNCFEGTLILHTAGVSRQPSPTKAAFPPLISLHDTATRVLNIRRVWVSFLIWIVGYPKCAACQFTRLQLLDSVA